jgi:hypothetical protein
MHIRRELYSQLASTQRRPVRTRRWRAALLKQIALLSAPLAAGPGADPDEGGTAGVREPRRPRTPTGGASSRLDWPIDH